MKQARLSWRRAQHLAALLSGLWIAVSPAAARPVDRPASGPPLAYDFVAGQVLSYAVTYRSAGNADFTALLAQTSQTRQPASMLSYRIAAGLTGRMEVTILSAGSATIEELVVFRDPVVTLVINGQAQTAETEQIAGQLTRGFLVTLSPDGKVVSLRMSADSDRSSRDFVRTLMAGLQVVLPQARSGGWTTSEDDPNGSYLAQYRRVGSAALVKSALRYLPTPDAPGPHQMQKLVTPKTSLKIQIDPDGTGLLALEGSEIADTAVQGKHVSHTETTLRLTRTSRANLSPDAQAGARTTAATLAAGAVSLTLFQSRSAREVEANVQSAELGAATEDDLLAQLAALNAAGSGADSSAANALYLKLKALAAVRPDSAAAMGERLAAADAQSLTFRLLSAALGAVGNPQAQDALVAAIRAHPDDWPALSRLAPELCGLPEPSPAAEDTVRGLTASDDPNVRAMAILCLGGMAHGLATSAPDRSKILIAALAQQLAAATAENDQANLLEALGNAGSPLALPIVEPYAASPSPRLRAAALDALRAIPLGDVDPRLLSALRGDPDAKVRLEAAFALGFRDPSARSFAAETAAFRAETDDKVRAALLQDIAKMTGRFPQGRSLIRRAAERDASEYVRKSARGLLPPADPTAPAATGSH